MFSISTTNYEIQHPCGVVLMMFYVPLQTFSQLIEASTLAGLHSGQVNVEKHYSVNKFVLKGF